MLGTILFYALIAILILVGVIIVALVIGGIAVSNKVHSLQFNLPWLQWLTIDDVVQSGLSRFWSALALDILNDKGYLETRFNEGFEGPEYQRERMREAGFSYYSISWYEFRLTKRSGRGRWGLRLPPIFRSPEQPAPA